MSDEPECAGEGRCHGCMGWCDVCGNVSTTCHSDDGCCDRHHCGSCRTRLTYNDLEHPANNDHIRHCLRCIAANHFVRLPLPQAEGVTDYPRKGL